MSLLLPLAAPGQASWALLPSAGFGSFCKKNGGKECGGSSWNASCDTTLPMGREAHLQEHERASSPAEGIKNPIESRELLICLSQHMERKKYDLSRTRASEHRV